MFAGNDLKMSEGLQALGKPAKFSAFGHRSMSAPRNPNIGPPAGSSST